MELTDRELVAMACKGDADAFGELVKRYASAVYGVAYHKIGDFHLAHDIAQEAFIRAYLALTDLKDPARVGSWLYSITK